MQLGRKIHFPSTIPLPWATRDASAQVCSHTLLACRLGQPGLAHRACCHKVVPSRRLLHCGRATPESFHRSHAPPRDLTAYLLKYLTIKNRMLLTPSVESSSHHKVTVPLILNTVHTARKIKLSDLPASILVRYPVAASSLGHAYTAVHSTHQCTPETLTR